MPITAAASNVALQSTSPEPICEDVVYFSFSVSPHVAHLFNSDRRADSRLAQVEEDCQCSILVNAKRHSRTQEKTRHRSTGDVTVEVLMDENSGNFAHCVARLNDLVRRHGGQFRIRRLIKKLSLANGSKIYQVEKQKQQQQQHNQQQQQQLQNKGPTDILGTDVTHQIGSTVTAFAEEADGHWSIYSMVSPFIELKQPLTSTDMSKDLWIHAVRLLASCTRSMVTEAAAGELIVFSSYSKSAQDSSCGEAVFSDGDSSMASEDATKATNDRNWSHEPEAGLIQSITALLCDKMFLEDTIENFVCSASNSTSMQVIFLPDIDADCLTPRFTEPLVTLNSTECLAELQRAGCSRQAQTAISASCTNSATNVIVTGNHQTFDSGQLMIEASFSCQHHGVALINGSLGRALKCPGKLHSSKQLNLAACITAQLACLKNSEAIMSVADEVILCSAELTSQATDLEAPLCAPRRDMTVYAARKFQSACVADGHAGGRIMLMATSASCEETIAHAQRMAHAGCRGTSGGPASPLVLRPVPINHPVQGARLQLTSGACEYCHAGASACQQAQDTNSRLAGCQDSITVQCTCRSESQAINCSVGLPRLLTAEKETMLMALCNADCSFNCSHSFVTKAESENAPANAWTLTSFCERHRCTAHHPDQTVTQSPAGIAPTAEFNCPPSGVDSHADCRWCSGCIHQEVVFGLLQPSYADVDELSQLAVVSSSNSITCNDCQQATASLSFTRTAPMAKRYADRMASLLALSEGTRSGSYEQLTSTALGANLNEFAPIQSRNYMLSGFESIQGLGGSNLSNRKGGGAVDCVLSSQDKLKALACHQRIDEVSEINITLQAAHYTNACRDQVSGQSTRCNHGQEMVCQVSWFGQDSGMPFLPADSWHQLTSLVADTVAALEWMAAWPIMCQDQAVLSSAESLKALFSLYSADVVPFSKLTLNSELVWNSLRRIQLGHSLC